MSEDSGLMGVVIAHGGMAAGLVDAVRRIAGSSADALAGPGSAGLDRLVLGSRGIRMARMPFR